MARWTASAKWGEAPALDGQCATQLGLALSEVLGHTLRCWPHEAEVELPPNSPSLRLGRGGKGWCSSSAGALRALRGLKNRSTSNQFTLLGAA